MLNFNYLSIPEAFADLLWKAKLFGQEEQSRNGAVLAFPAPVGVSVYNPMKRVLTDPLRDANPFFHVMEFVWMMAGSNDIQWIARFNKNMLRYSDDGQTQHAAYGFRWREHFGVDQITEAVEMLKANPQDRRVVLQMWDTEADLGCDSVDLPCNTQLMFRVKDGHLNTLVTNRSNDLVWGQMGANAVHMTLLHELIARSAGYKVGTYSVVSNNLHIYKDVPNFDEYMAVPREVHDVYREAEPFPILQKGETLEAFLTDCEAFYRDANAKMTTVWMAHVAQPMFFSWFNRVGDNLNEIQAEDWRIACQQWVARRAK